MQNVHGRAIIGDRILVVQGKEHQHHRLIQPKGHGELIQIVLIRQRDPLHNNALEEVTPHGFSHLLHVLVIVTQLFFPGTLLLNVLQLPLHTLADGVVAFNFQQIVHPVMPECLISVVKAVIGSQDQKMAFRPNGLHLIQKLQAAHARHGDVCNHDVKPHGADDVQRGHSGITAIKFKVETFVHQVVIELAMRSSSSTIIIRYIFLLSNHAYLRAEASQQRTGHIQAAARLVQHPNAPVDIAQRYGIPAGVVFLSG